MLECWKFSPEDRPTFHDINSKLEAILLSKVPYVDLGENTVHNIMYDMDLPANPGEVLIHILQLKMDSIGLWF